MRHSPDLGHISAGGLIQSQSFDSTSLGASDVELIASLLDKGKPLSDA